MEQFERREVLSVAPLISPAISPLVTGASSLVTVVGPSTQSTSPVIASLTQVTLPFSDDFNTATNQQLSSNWLNQLGTFQVANGLATGQAHLNIATLNGVNAADVAVQADVNLTGASGQSAGLVARYSRSASQNLYLGRLVNTGAGFKVELLRKVGSDWTTLFTQAVGSGSGRLRFEVAGSSLKLFLDNILVAFANDSQLTSGTVGIAASTGGTLDNFNAALAPLTNVTLPFNDSFNTAVNQQLSSNWQNQFGNFQVSSGLATGQAHLNVATLNGVNAADVGVQAEVNVTGAAGQSVGLIARYSGARNQNFYRGKLVNTGTGFQVEIWRKVSGTWTKLATEAVGSGSGTLRFEVVGSSLKLFLDNILVAFANDSQLTSGTVGVEASAGGTADNFSAAAAPLTTVTSPFNDNFNTATNQQLSSNWLNQLGNFQVSGGLATGQAHLNLATVNGISAATVALQADVNVTGASGRSAGLVARYSGARNQNFFLAKLVNNGTGFNVELWRKVSGDWTKLATKAVGSGLGTLRITIEGNALKLFFNNVHIISKTDSHLTAAGLVGMLASDGSTLDNFQVG